MPMAFSSIITWFSRPCGTCSHQPHASMSWTSSPGVLGCSICPGSLYCRMDHYYGLKDGGCCSVAQSCPTLCDPMDSSTQTSLSFTISQSLLRFMSVDSVKLSNHLVLCRPFLLLPSIFPTIRVFSNESALHIWAEVCPTPNSHTEGLRPRTSECDLNWK